MNVFDLFARLFLDTDDYEKKLDDAKNDAEKKGSKLGSKLASGLGTAVKVGMGVVTAASGAVVTITKNAVDSYGEYEQLAGGIETLFGKNANTVMANADKAFKTAGMSVNEYMDTSIQSAAALINSLAGDQAKAAELMDMSIVDMSDNVNKMGTSMEAVQNAYRGFSRGNFTMLDNLALGFSGTKEGMQELLDKAHELSGVEYDIDSYSDIVQAIHVVQTEMGITGTTSKEASDTISGSVGQMKKAWENLVTGLANPNADLKSLIGQLVDSAEGAFKNLLPIVENALMGVSELITRIAPILVEKMPEIITNLLPEILNNGMQITQSLVQGIMQSLPQLLDVAVQVILSLSDFLIQSLPTMIPAIVEIIYQLVEVLTKPETLNQLIDVAIELVLALTEGMIDALPRLIDATALLISNLIMVILQKLPEILGTGEVVLAEFLAGILMKVPDLLEGIGEIMMSLIAGIVAFFVPMEETGDELIEKIAGAIDEGMQKAKEWGTDLIENFISGIKSKIGAVKDAVGNVANTVKDFLGFSEPETGPLSNFHTFAPDMIDLFTQGINDNLSRVQSASYDFASAMVPEQAGGLQLAGAGAGGGDIIIPVYIGSDKIDEVIVNAEQVRNYRGGGR